MNFRLCLVLAAAIILTGPGCATHRAPPFAESQQHPPASLPAEFHSTCDRLGVAPTRYVLAVDVSRQTVSLFDDGKFVKMYSCSTSRHGVGEKLNSFRTPLGLHRIAEKIGDGEPPGTIFKDRQAVGSRSAAAGGIRTRIMRLEGLEPGFNQGFNGSTDVDTHDREIYIHGTGDQASIGQPASIGCIHLADPDLIALFDLLPSGTLVWIAKR